MSEEKLTLEEKLAKKEKLTQEEVTLRERDWTPFNIVEELAAFFNSEISQKKRVEGIIVPTDENIELLEDYLSRWSWIIVQKLSEPGTVKSEFSPEDSKLSLQDVVLEIVLYGIAYLAAHRNLKQEYIQGKEGATDYIVKDGQKIVNDSPLKGADVKLGY